MGRGKGLRLRAEGLRVQRIEFGLLFGFGFFWRQAPDPQPGKRPNTNSPKQTPELF